MLRDSGLVLCDQHAEPWTKLAAAEKQLLAVHDALHRECDGTADLPAEIMKLRQERDELLEWKAAACRGADLLTEILGRPTATIGGFAAVTLVEAAEERMARIRDLEAGIDLRVEIQQQTNAELEAERREHAKTRVRLNAAVKAANDAGGEILELRTALHAFDAAVCDNLIDSDGHYCGDTHDPEYACPSTKRSDGRAPFDSSECNEECREFRKALDLYAKVTAR